MGNAAIKCCEEIKATRPSSVGGCTPRRRPPHRFNTGNQPRKAAVRQMIWRMLHAACVACQTRPFVDGWSSRGHAASSKPFCAVVVGMYTCRFEDSSQAVTGLEPGCVLVPKLDETTSRLMMFDEERLNCLGHGVLECTDAADVPRPIRPAFYHAMPWNRLCTCVCSGQVHSRQGVGETAHENRDDVHARSSAGQACVTASQRLGHYLAAWAHNYTSEPICL